MTLYFLQIEGAQYIKPLFFNNTNIFLKILIFFLFICSTYIHLLFGRIIGESSSTNGLWLFISLCISFTHLTKKNESITAMDMGISIIILKIIQFNSVHRNYFLPPNILYVSINTVNISIPIFTFEFVNLIVDFI